MQFEDFQGALHHKLPVGTILPNPGGGISTVLSYTNTQMVYLRGSSRIYVEVRAFYDAFLKFGALLSTPAS